MSLSSLPFDILHLVFRLLSTRDVIRVGTMCRFLHAATQEHHVWLDQVRNCLKQNPSLRLLSLSVDTLSTEDLHRFAIRQAKIRIRWDQPPNPKDKFASPHHPFSRGLSCLLPGGNAILWAAVHTGDIKLYRPRDIQISPWCKPFWVDRMDEGWIAKRLIQTTSPHPVIAYSQRTAVALVTMSEHGGITPMFSRTYSGRTYFAHFHGQERLVCFLVDPEDPEACSITVVHLDYPDTTLRVEIPNVVNLSAHRFDICLPCPDLLAVSDRDEIRIYRLPDFSTLGSGTQWLKDGPIYTLNNPFEDVSEMLRDGSVFNLFNFIDQVYDPFSAPAFNLHLQDQETGIIFTFTIDPSSPRHQATPVLHRLEVTHPMISFLGPIPPAKGLSYELNVTEQGPIISVLPFADMGREDKRGVLKLYVPWEVLDGLSGSVSVDVDEGSGRVLLNSWDIKASIAKLFIGELVQ